MEMSKYLDRYFEDESELKVVKFEFAAFSGGRFPSLDALIDRWALLPLVWWQYHGSAFPTLQSLAFKLLGQPCSSSCAERNWSTYKFIHSLKRNKMAPARAEDLVYVHSNLRLLSSRNVEYVNTATKMWDSMIEKVKAVIYRYEGLEDDQYSSFWGVVNDILIDRWTKNSTPLHCLAHSLNPK